MPVQPYSMLGPKLFKVLINDIPDTIGSQFNNYADDNY